VEFQPSADSSWYLLETQGEGDVLKTAGVHVVTAAEGSSMYFRPTYIVAGAGGEFPELQAERFLPVESAHLVDAFKDAAEEHAPALVEKQRPPKKKRQRESQSDDDAECAEASGYRRSAKQRKHAKKVTRTSLSASSSSINDPAVELSQSQAVIEEEAVEKQAEAKGLVWYLVHAAVDISIVLPTTDQAFADQLNRLLSLDRNSKLTLIAARQIIVLSDKEIEVEGVVSEYSDERYQVSPSSV